MTMPNMPIQKMEVTISSELDGKSAGYIVFSVSSNCTVGNLLKLYCSEKGIEASENYVLCGRGNIVFDPLKTLKEEGIKNAENIKFSQADKNEQLFAFGSWWMITLIAFLIGSFGLAYSLYLVYFPLMLPQKFGLVIDAGSSHSQLFVFSWVKLEIQGTANVELIHDCTMSGGVAEFRFHTGDLHSYFEPCIKEAEELIPISVRPNTPLILAATAGMRILRAFDPDGSNLVLSAIREIFWSKTSFHTRHRDVFVASGQHEGIYGWAAVNYLMKNFQETEDPEESSEKETQASALDLGGASVQVTTELAANASLTWPTVNITIFNYTYNIYSKSFLCYGVGQAMQRYQYLLVRNLSKEMSREILNPCLPKGFSISLTSEDFLSPCIFSNDPKVPPTRHLSSKYSKKFAAKYFGHSFPSPGSLGEVFPHSAKANQSVYVLKGSSDTNECRKQVESLFDYQLCKKNFVLGDCLNKKLVPPYLGELVGFSSIFHKLLPLLGVSTEGSLNDFKIAVLQTCSRSSQELMKMHPNTSAIVLEDLCFDGMYVYTLLKDGLGITSHRWKNILFIHKLNEQDVVWAMGLMLNRTSYLKPQNATRLLDPFNLALLLLISTIFLVIGSQFLCYSFKMKRRGNAYQRVLTTVLDP